MLKVIVALTLTLALTPSNLKCAEVEIDDTNIAGYGLGCFLSLVRDIFIILFLILWLIHSVMLVMY